MMRKLAVIMILLLLPTGLPACRFVEEPPTEPETVTVREYLTDMYGHEVPVFEDVERSSFDPSKFMLLDNGRMTYEDESIHVMNGIDVSVFQNEIDWNAVASDGIEYAMLRIGGRGYGEGKLYEDTSFPQNFSGAKAAGLHVGVYFFSQAITVEEAVEEARYVLQILNGAELDFPVAFDWEHVDDTSARTAEIGGLQITSFAKAFCDAITDAGYPAVIYFNREHGYFNYELSLIKNYHFWYAEYADVPSFVYDYKMWQYTETGKVNGINGNVDLNLALFPAAG